MSGLSTYFHPDDVMLKLAGVLYEGLKYHAAAMQLVSADDQVDDIAYEEAIEQAVAKDPKMVLAAAFRDNKLDVLPKVKQFFRQQMKLNVSFSRMRRRFVREIARITRVPVLKPPSNVNVPDQAMPITIGNVTSMDKWREREKQRKSA